MDNERLKNLGDGNYFEELLNVESRKILDKILVIHEKKEKINKSFVELILELAENQYKYFHINLDFKIRQLLPDNLDTDLKQEYIVVSKEEPRKQHLQCYEKHYESRMGRNHKQTFEKLADILIEYCLRNPKCNEDLLQLIVKNMSAVMPEHNDSIYCRVILMYLQQDIVDKGYIVINFSPLRIKKAII